MTLEKIFEDENIVAVNKPAGLMVHSDGKTGEKTLTDFLLEEYPEIKGVGELLGDIERPGIVHRLDKDTSGVFIIAKNRETAQLLTSLFRLRKVHKTYLAICHGEIESDKGEWISDLIRYENGKKIIEKARTLYKVIDKNSLCSLVEMKPITGRKHQLRKQLYEIGNSIFGDTKYRNTEFAKGINKELMLHSYQIKFMINEKKYTYTALLPDYFKKLIKTKRLKFSN